MRKFAKDNWISGLALLTFLVAWELFALFNVVDQLYIGVPHQIFLSLWVTISEPAFLSHLGNSGRAFLMGYCLAVLGGAALGFATSLNKVVRQVLSPFILIFNSLPFVAILPLLIIWFGMGIFAKTVMVFLMVFPSITIHVSESIRMTDKDIKVMFQSFGANKWQTVRKLYIYQSLPYIFSGARIGIGRGLIAIIVAEIYGLGKGIAYYIPYYGATFQTDRLLASVLVIISINFFLVYLLNVIRQRVVFWGGETAVIKRERP